MERVGGFGGKSDQLNAYNVYLGDPGFFQNDLSRYQRVTGASLRNAVRRHLARPERVALSIVPRGRPALAVPGSQPSLVS